MRGPAWLVLGATLLGYAVGSFLARRLAVAAYRIVEDETHPLPGKLWTVPVVVAAAWGLLAWAIGGRASGLELPAYLLLGLVGVALARIDADVHRLPQGLTHPTAVLVPGLLAVSTVATGRWAALGWALVIGLLVGVVFLLLAVLPGGGFGLGDALLGTILGVALGYLHAWLPAAAVLVAVVLAGMWTLVQLVRRRVTLRGHIAFGPFLLLGALLALLAWSAS